MTDVTLTAELGLHLGRARSSGPGSGHVSQRCRGRSWPGASCGSLSVFAQRNRCVEKRKRGEGAAQPGLPASPASPRFPSHPQGCVPGAWRPRHSGRDEPGQCPVWGPSVVPRGGQSCPR